MSSPPISPRGNRRTNDTSFTSAVPPSQSQLPTAPKSSIKSTRDMTSTNPSGKPKSKKDIEAERLAALEEAERTKKQPLTGSGIFEFKNGAVYEGEWMLCENSAPAAPANPVAPSPVPPQPQQQQQGVAAAVPSTVTTSRKRHGHGRFTNGGDEYNGEWKEGQIHGKGKFRFASGAIYEGEFQQNRFHGRGTYHWSNGSSYIGDWYENKMHGNGAFLANTGDRYQGLFQNDRFRNEKGFWIAPNSSQQETASAGSRH